MPKTASGYLPLTDQTGGGNGTASDKFLWIYIDDASEPNKPSDSSGIPTGWSTTIPSVLVDHAWVSLGKQTAGIGNYVWSNVLLSTGTQGTTSGNNGVNGQRGSGTFKYSFNTVKPTLNDSTFLANASTAVGGTPIHGDVVELGYTDGQMNAVLDGSTWKSFAMQIDGNLLVNGTVVADSIQAGAIISNQIKGGSKTGATSNDGKTGFFLDGTGNFSIGDGVDDMFMIGGGMNIPAVNTKSPISKTVSIGGNPNNSPRNRQDSVPFEDHTDNWVETSNNVEYFNPGVNTVFYSGNEWYVVFRMHVGLGYGYNYVSSFSGDVTLKATVEAINNSTGVVVDTRSVTESITFTYASNGYHPQSRVYANKISSLSILDTINALGLAEGDNTTDFNTQYPTGIKFRGKLECISNNMAYFASDGVTVANSTGIDNGFCSSDIYGTVHDEATCNALQHPANFQYGVWHERFQPMEMSVEFDFTGSPVLQTTTEQGTPEDSYISYSTADSTKAVLTIEGGRGFRAKPEVIYDRDDSSTHTDVVERVHNNGNGTQPGVDLTFPVERIPGNSTYIFVMQNPSDDSPARSDNGIMKDIQLVFHMDDYVNSNYTGEQDFCTWTESTHPEVTVINAHQVTSGPNDFIKFQSYQHGDDSSPDSTRRHYKIQKIIRIF